MTAHLQWAFLDPTNAEVWQFPIGPNQADSIQLARVFTYDHTCTVPGGQPFIFEGGQVAKTWTFRGDLLTAVDVADLLSWRNRPYKVFIGDDLGRALVVKVVSIVTTDIISTDHPEAQSYVATCLLYGRVA